ncbi:MAG TPA: type VI secretion system ATPase TssH [Acidobacteriota bacterium]|nr:type VI secretion system ATPase TssH [Acidobacteriota bacterium]HQF86031.1 type VI secretion system ATPase TssH [Acidobacteriota bacterium]HQG90726.1 type VI secretion system ATPase TssH [Acidobacteriota bacterium]HQK86878.1 type VI secretion system ATPase TssH [Acidobacteriota bacterium]
MITVDIKSLLSRMNAFSTNALHAAAGLCVSRTHYEVSVEQVLVKLLEEPRSDCSLICQKFNLDIGRVIKALEESLEDFRTGNSSKPVFSPLLLELIQDAWMVASIDLGERRIRSGALLMALLAKPSFFASGRYIDLLKTINRETLTKDFWAVTKGSLETEAAAREPGGAAETAAGPSDGGFLKRFCTDFTQKARDGGIDPVFGRDLEIRQIVDILARRRKNNPICVGDPGVGKTAVVEGLALRIVQGDVPELLQNVSLLGLDMGLLEAGAGMKGEFENRLKGVISEIKGSEKPIVLFIDEAHTLIGAGGSAGTSDAANLLKPALARGELRTVAATTWGEYKKYFEKDPALARRFQAVKLDEPSVETTILILRGIRDSYEAAHKVIIRDDAIRAAAELSDKYITGRFLPDKAIDLVDTACARIKINLSAKPGVLEDKERAVQALEREKGAVDRDRTNGIAVDEEAYQKVLDRIAAFRAEAEALRARWQGEKEAAQKVLEIRGRLAALGGEPAADKDALKQELVAADAAFHALQADGGLIQVEVNPDVVAQVVSDWTGIPLGKVLRDEAENILRLEERLAERIKGQDHALKIIVETIKSAKAGIKNPNQPMGVFLLAGPSGVGKTETGLALADLLFGSDRNVVTINMSEFQESHTVSRLIGSPPGYVGYGEGGMLTEAVRQKPYSVVLLDEVEKAHLDVLNLFYQVFDKGMLTDGEGKEINFRNTIILLTSNLASDIIQEMTAGDEPLPTDAVVGAIRPVLSKHFKPALLARMAIVPYYGLRGEAMKRIVELKLRRIQRTLMENNKMAFDYTPAVMDQIAARCTEVETGARNIEYILDGNILPQLSQRVLAQMSEGAMPTAVHLDVDAAGAFTFRFDTPTS